MQQTGSWMFYGLYLKHKSEKYLPNTLAFINVAMEITESSIVVAIVKFAIRP